MDNAQLQTNLEKIMEKLEEMDEAFHDYEDETHDFDSLFLVNNGFLTGYVGAMLKQVRNENYIKDAQDDHGDCSCAICRSLYKAN